MKYRYSPNIAIEAKDASTAAVFYRDLFGMKVAADTADSVQLVSDQMNFHIDKATAPEPGKTYFEFEVDDFEAAKAQLASAGCELRPSGIERGIMATDPFGYNWHIYQPEKPSFDWSQFTLKVYVKASPAALFHAWTNRRGLESWFCDRVIIKSPEGKERGSDEQVQAGDAWAFEHGAFKTDCKYLELEENRRIRFNFDGPTVVTEVSLEAKGDYTEVTLKQTDMPTSEKARTVWHMSCRLGWAYYLENLKARYQFGIDLRESDLSLRSNFGDGVC